MPKKQKVEIQETVNLAKDIIKRYGHVISAGVRILEKKKNLRTITVSPSFDLSLNGGILEGSWTIISGDPKTGKSSTCLQICANGQKEGRNIIYLDGESRLKDYNLVGIEGLDLDTIQIIHSPDDSPPLSAEDFLNILETLLKMPENEGAIAVIDSCSALVPRSELDSEASGTIRASLPKLLAHWIKKNAQTIVKQKIALLIITHYITNTSGYGKTKIPDCGKYLQYQADTLIDCKKCEPWEEAGVKVGQIIEWDISCSSKGASGKKCISYLRYGKGIDFIQEILVLGEELGLIDKAGAWYTLPFLDGEVENYEVSNYRFQGQAKLYEYLNTNPDIFNILNKKVKEMLC